MDKIRYAVFLDIDGTLVWGKPTTSENNARALRRAREQGHLICINSGRSRGNIPENLLEQIDFDGIVAGGGAYVSLHGKLLNREEIPASLVRDICGLFLEIGICCVIEGETTNGIVNPALLPTFEGSSIPIRSMEDAARFAETEHATKLTVIAVKSVLPPTVEKLLSPHFHIIYHPNYTEAILKQCNKARGMAILLKAAGIPQKDSIAVGDSLNDMEMLQYAGLSVAMGNAVEEVKAAADHVVSPVLEDGVAEVIERYVFGVKEQQGKACNLYL